MTTADRSALCLQSPLKSALSTSTRHNSKTTELLPYKLPIHQIQHVFFAKIGLINEKFLFIKKTTDI